MFGNTALHYAVDKSRKDTVIWLITNGANINRQDFRGNTPLHIACVNNDVEVVKILLNRNADPTITDLANSKPFDKTNLPTIKKLIDLKIESLYSKTDENNASQTVNWMSFGVGLGKCIQCQQKSLCFILALFPGVGMGMALAKRQQALMEQYLDQQKEKEQEELKHRRRGRLSAGTGRRDEGGRFSPNASAGHAVGLSPQAGKSGSLVVFQSSASDRKFL